MDQSQRHVHVVDDHADVRTSLASLLTMHGFEVFEYESTLKFLDVVEHLVGVVLLDLRMPDMTGLDVLELIQGKYLGLSVILMSGHGDIRSAVTSLKLGAIDFLEKPYDEDALITVVEAAFEGLTRRLESNEYDQEARSHAARLSPREKDVVEGLVRGLPSKLLAHRLGISVRTVEMHRSRAMSRMNCKTLTELVAKSVRGGIR